MPQAFPLPNKIALGSDKRIKMATISVSFGDGYQQDAPSGINSQRDEWSISWIWLNDADRDAVRAALDAVGGWDYLTWTPPGSAVSKKFKVIPDSRFESFNAGYTKIGCALRQVF